MRNFPSSVKVLSVLMAFLVVLSCKNVYQDPSKPVEDRINDLLKKMTLDEKLELLSGDSSGFDTKGIERLGIPALHLSDGPLGVRTGKATSFPAGVEMAATWDTTLIYDVAQAEAMETKAKGRNYLLGPCVCIHRFPLGGRNFESYSEDPFLASRLAVNWVKGLQDQHVICSVKHFAMNDQERDRNNYDVIIDERTMREIHLPAFEAAVKEANALSVMSAYNIVNGQHCSENFHLLTDILKKDWGFKGLVVSDWVSVYSTVNAANAGLDLEMPTGVYFRKDSLLKAIKEGTVSEEVINDKVRRQLRVRFEAGLFDRKETPDTTVLTGEEHKKLARKAAQEGIVLLKNDNILPLDKNKIKSIAVIGPNAEIARTGGGGSSFVDPYYSVSPLQGLTNAVGKDVKIVFSEGDKIEGIKINAIPSKYLFTPDKKSNGLLGEYFNNKDLSGNPVLTRIDTAINFDFGGGSPAKEIHDDYFSIRWTGILKPTETKLYKINFVSDDGVRIFIDDKKVLENWTVHGAAIDTANIRLEAGKEYRLKIEFFENMGDAVAKLGWDIANPVKESRSIQEAAQVAKGSDVALVFVGASDYLESEGTDRKGLELPGRQDELIQAVAKVNPNTIVVINGGTPVKVDKWIKQVKGLVHMFYSGQETGNAIASILFGEVNPSGKLPFSFISDYKQSPTFKTYFDKSLKIPYSEGVFVGYRYLDKNNLQPAYPFGFGLSYTTFAYRDLGVKPLGNNAYEVTLKIKNTGKVQGDEIAQLYIGQKKCSVPRPVKELKAFSRVSLNPGEEKTITMRLNPRSFAFWDDATKNWKIESGDFDILVGSSSRDIKVQQQITLK